MSETADAPAERSNRWSRQIIGPFTVRHLAIVVVVLVVATLILSLLTTPLGARPGPQPVTPGSGFYQVGEPTIGLALGQVAPELEGIVDGKIVGLRSLQGDVLRLADRQGKPTWINFFASWCPPCQEEVPVLRETYERYAPQGLEMIAVSVQETTPDDVAAYADTYDLSYPIGFDATSAVFHAYQGFGIPTHVFVDADGVIRYLQYGPIDREQVAAVVEPLLAEAASSPTPRPSSPTPRPSSAAGSSSSAPGGSD